MGEATRAEERFRVKGDGPDNAPVVLMSNSLGCDLTMWDDIVPTLAQKYRVVRYDTRGHGGSVVVNRPTSIAELAEDALAILDELGVERAHYVGLSMGGMIGQWLLRHAPDRLDRVVLCNTAPMMGPPDLWNTRIRTAREKGMAALLPATLERWFTPEFRARKPEGLARVAKMFEATDPEGYASCCAAIRDMDQRWPLRAVLGDVTVLVGARDPGTTPAMGRQIADAIPGARLVSVDAAHISVVERPEAAAAAILAALAAPSRKAARKPAAPRRTAPAPRPARAAARARATARRAAPAPKQTSAHAPAKAAKPARAPSKTTTKPATPPDARSGAKRAAKAGTPRSAAPTATKVVTPAGKTSAVKPQREAPAMAPASIAGKKPGKGVVKSAAKAATKPLAAKPASTKPASARSSSRKVGASKPATRPTPPRGKK